MVIQPVFPPYKPLSSVSRRPRRSSDHVTLADVARAAGVSPITVSRVLRAEPGVTPAMAERVRSFAAELDYVPNPAARALASQRSAHVLILVPMLSNALFVDLLDEAYRALLPAGYLPLIGITHYDEKEEELLLRTYLPHQPAGLLVTGFDRSEVARHLIHGSSTPCVHLMEISPAPGVYSVGFSQADAGFKVAEHLLARGRRRIAFCAAQLDPRTLQRAEGYRNCLRSAGLYDPRLEFLSPERSSMALGAHMLGELLARAPDVDGIFFCNDDLAQGALLEANRLGLSVPRQIAMAGFNDLEGSDQMLPPLTTVRTPRGAIGRAGAQMLLSLMRGEPVSPACVDLDVTLVVRGST